MSTKLRWSDGLHGGWALYAIIGYLAACVLFVVAVVSGWRHDYSLGTYLLVLCIFVEKQADGARDEVMRERTT